MIAAAEHKPLNKIIAVLLAVTLVSTLVTTTMITPIAADEEDKFVVYRLNVAGQLLQHWVEDLNQDGLKDIFVIHRKGLEPNETRWVSIFWQDANSGFGTAADQAWEVATEAVILDIGDVNGDASKEICFITGDGVYYYPFDGESYVIEPEKILDSSSLAVYPSRRGIPLTNFIRDWNGNGNDEIALVTFEGLSIYSRDEAGAFSSENKVNVELETTVYRTRSQSSGEKTDGITANYKFPNVQLLDYNNDGRRDLIATTDDRVIVYLQQEDGTYSSNVDQNHYFDVMSQEEKIEHTAEVETLVSDLNNDGYVDAIVTKQTSKGLTSFRGVVNVFWGKPDGYSATPDQVIISEGTASAQAAFLDVNGDGRKDLVLPSIKFSVAAIIRILVTRSIKVYFNVFLLNDDGKLSERPDFTKEVKFKIDFSGDSDEQAMDLEGDYNGDKRTDFVFATKRDELSIYLGIGSGGDRLFTKKPVAKIKADAYGELSSPDLNNDGFADMIIVYSSSKKQGTLEVLINQKRW